MSNKVDTKSEKKDKVTTESNHSLEIISNDSQTYLPTAKNKKNGDFTIEKKIVQLPSPTMTEINPQPVYIRPIAMSMKLKILKAEIEKGKKTLTIDEANTWAWGAREKTRNENAYEQAKKQEREKTSQLQAVAQAKEATARANALAAQLTALKK